MEIAYDRNRLGVGLAVSLLIHLILLFFIAAISSVDMKPVVPKSKDFFVEIFDGTVDKKDEKPSKKTSRLGKETSRVEKEMAPPPSSLPPEAVSIQQPPLPLQPDSVPVEGSQKLSHAITGEKSTSETQGSDLYEKVPVMQEGLRISANSTQKKLPGMNTLMPSYERLSMQRPSADTVRDVEMGNAVSLNTTEFKYISYFSKIKRQIQMVWKYPESARREGIKGILLLKFSINREGHLTAVHLLRSSGSSLLDNAAIAALRDANPFFPLPDNLGEKLEIAANFEYELNGYYFR